MSEIDVYRPTKDEDYMNQKQLAYFEKVLTARRNQIITSAISAKNELKESWLRGPDLFDIAASQAEIALDLGDLERNRAQLRRIENALAKIKSGEYGYCEITGDKIGLKRLEAQPFATLCIEAQESFEREVKGMRVPPKMGEVMYSY